MYIRPPLVYSSILYGKKLRVEDPDPESDVVLKFYRKKDKQIFVICSVGKILP